jgi:hypothetical protein
VVAVLEGLVRWGRRYAEDTYNWFAWRPVRLKDGSWAWLERVSRHKEWVDYNVYQWVYEEIYL